MQQKIREKGKTTFKLSLFDRLIMIPANILGVLLFLLFGLKLVHYNAIPLPQVFSSPSLMQSMHLTPSYTYNFILYLSFYFQHMIMATIIFKISLWRFIPNYPLYERYIYNILSSWLYLLIFEVAKPISLES